MHAVVINSPAAESLPQQSAKQMFSTTEPRGRRRSSATSVSRPGRRLVVSAPSSQQQSIDKEKAKTRARLAAGNATLEELDKILEEDALALLNIKKDITSQQNEELEKIRVDLLAAKREYDNLVVQNNRKESELRKLEDKLVNMINVEKVTESTQISAKNSISELQEQIAQVLEDLAAEQRTIKMQTLMMKRLDEEIDKCRLDTSKALVNVEQVKHEVAIVESNLHLNRQYLLEEEMQLDKLQNTLKSRKDQREGKINMLHFLSMEGENSVAKLQQSLVESSRVSFASHTHLHLLMTKITLYFYDSIKLTPSAEKTTRTVTTVKSVGKAKSDVGDDIVDLNRDMSELAYKANRMNIQQIRDAIQRYQSHAPRIERLQQLDNELKNNLAHQLKKKTELSDHLTQTQFKIHQLASSRQIYQEVDLKDSILAAASKEYEEAKEREFRLRLNLESLKQSIPRFLTKITKSYNPKPNDSQVKQHFAVAFSSFL